MTISRKKKKMKLSQWRQRARAILTLEAKAVARQAKQLDGGFLKAAQAILRCKRRVVVMGIGKSGLIGRKLAATLSSTGTPAFFVHPTESVHGDLGMLAKGDVVLLLSYSGETEELKKILHILKIRQLLTVAVTGRPSSILGRSSKIVVNVAIDKEACPYNITPTASTTAMLAVGDALALLVMELRGFDQYDFARLHPAGSLGKKLTLRVADLMHKGRNNPIVHHKKSVQSALLVMTRTRLGAASVVNDQGRLVGVFTDGDLRRSLQKDPSLLSKPIGKVMSRSPRTLSPEDMVMEALPLFQRFGLDNFPVVDQKKRPLGVLDERDLLDEGLL